MSFGNIGALKLTFEQENWDALIEMTNKDPRLAKWMSEHITILFGWSVRVQLFVEHILSQACHVSPYIWPILLRECNYDQLEKLLNTHELPLHDITDNGENILHITSYYCTVDMVILFVKRTPLSLLFQVNKYGQTPWDRIRQYIFLYPRTMTDLIISKPALYQHFNEKETKHTLPHLKSKELDLIKNFAYETCKDNSLPSLMLSIIAQQTSLYLYGVSNK